MLIVTDKIEVPLRELKFTFSRSSGPGGQNVNKVNSKATLHWNVTGTASLAGDVRDRFVARYKRRINRQGELVIISGRFRDQGRNVADCLERLRAMLMSIAQPPKRRRVSRPSQAVRARRLKDKRLTSEKKKGRRTPGSEE